MSHLKFGRAIRVTALTCIAAVCTLAPAAADPIITNNNTWFAGEVDYANQVNLTDLFLLYTDTTGTVTGINYLGPSCPGGNVCFPSIAFKYEDPSYYLTSGYLTVAGIYNVGGKPSGVVIGVNSSVAGTAMGQSFSSVFGGASESAVINDLANDPADAFRFFVSNLSDFFPFTADGVPVEGQLLDFSNGSNGGTLSVTVVGNGTPYVSGVPEPANDFLVLTGGPLLIAISKLRKRFTPGAPARAVRCRSDR